MLLVIRLQNQNLQRRKLILNHLPRRSLLKLLKEKRIKTSAKGDKAAKMKQYATKSKGLTVLSEVALSEADQMKLVTKRSKKEFYSSHVSGSGDGVDIQSKVPDEQQHTASSTNEGAGDKPEEENDEHDNANDNDDEDDNQENDSGETKSDDDRDNFVHPNLSTYKSDDQEKEKEEEKANDDDEVSSNRKVSTPSDYEILDEKENQEDDDNVMGGEQENEEDEELYGYLNLNLDKQDVEMTDAQTNQETEEVHVTLTTEPPVVQQQSSSVSLNLVSKFINPSSDTCIDSILNPNIQLDIPVNVSVSATTETPSSDTIIPQPPILIIQSQQQTHDTTTTTTIPTTTLPEIPNFASLFGFKRRVSSLETELAELKQTNQFAEALSFILGIVDNYLASKMKDAVNVAVRLQSNKLREEAQAENDEFLKQIDSNINAIIKDQVKAKVSKIMPKVEKRSGKEESSKEATQKKSKSTSSSKGASRSQPKSLGKSTQAEEHCLRVDDLEEPLYQEFNTGNDDVSPVREIIAVDERLWNPSGTQSLFNEFLVTPIDFSAFITNRLKLNNLAQDVLTVPTYDLMKGTYWHNPEGRPYPHDLSKPVPLIQNARGHQVIPFDHFINNDLEYLKGWSLSQKYTTPLTKMKAADYGHVKWIKDKVPISIWSPAQVVYDKHAYWGTYHWDQNVRDSMDMLPTWKL
ncbi:hypothetical protein Tco_0824041 [Tanacetum coccineum]|uniref:Uncharacterized protein n=1 Tax=Tanacetum coccineum TaxID=301880 RepID=A0ABQ5AMN1_9ASTR